MTLRRVRQDAKASEINNNGPMSDDVCGGLEPTLNVSLCHLQLDPCIAIAVLQ